MAQPQHLGVSGLFTDPNVHVAVPEGALEAADECDIHRVGIIEGRPGFKAGTVLSSPGSGALEGVYALHPYRDAMLAVGPVESTVATVLSGGYGVALAAPEAAGNLAWERNYIRAAEARGNLYLNTSDTPRKITGTGADQVAYPVGAIAPTLWQAAPTVAGSVVPNNAAVSYRLCIKRTDANGVEVYSAPSGRVIARNTSGAARNVALAYAWHRTIAGDELQIYRSRTAVGVGVTPDDEHFLVMSLTLGTGSGTGSITDDILDLGAPLYIDEEVDELGEEDADASNFRPPACKDLALFRGSMIYANQRDYARLTFSRNITGGMGNARGIGLRVVSATYTNGSDIIGGFTATEILGVQIGQLVWNVAASMTFAAVPDPVFVIGVNVAAGEIQVSSTWTGVTGGAPLTLADSIRIVANGIPYLYPVHLAGLLVVWINSGGSDLVSGTVYTAIPEVHACGIGTIEDYTNSSPSVGYRTIKLEAYSAADSFRVTATHGNEYNPPLTQWATSGTAGTVEPDVRPNQLGWSKTEQPEHYLLGSFQAVGNSAPILRGIATRDAYWVLKGKGDGIYRMSGAGASSGFRIDPFDPSTYLLWPSLAVELDGVIYAWTNKGLVEISDAGVVPLSAGPIASETRLLETTLDHETSGGEVGAFAVANPKASQVIFGLPNMSGNTDRTVYVFSTKTRAFTRWFRNELTTTFLSEGADVNAGACNLATRALWFGMSESGVPRIERLVSEPVLKADSEYAITINSMVTSPLYADLTIAGGSGFTPSAGALIERSGEYGIVSAVTDATHFRVYRTPGFTTPGSATAYEAYRSTVSWRGKTAGAPGVVKRWQHVITHFESRHGLFAWIVQLTRNFGQGAIQNYARDTYERDAISTFEHLAKVKRSAHMAPRLTPSISIEQADSRWSCSGLSIQCEPITTQVRR